MTATKARPASPYTRNADAPQDLGVTLNETRLRPGQMQAGLANVVKYTRRATFTRGETPNEVARDLAEYLGLDTLLPRDF